jgi:hypothetical protein
MSIADQIIDAWRERCSTQHYSPEQQLTLQYEFIIGAMTALRAAGLSDAEAMPPKLVVPLVSNTNILKEVEHAELV